MNMHLQCFCQACSVQLCSLKRRVLFWALCLFAAMVYEHMSQTELALADKILKDGEEKEAIVLMLQSDRDKLGGSGPSRSAVYRYMKD